MPGEVALLSVHPHLVVLWARTWKAFLLGLGLVVGLLVLPLTGSVAQLRWFALLGVVLLVLVYLDLRYHQWRSESATITDRRVVLVRRRYWQVLALDLAGPSRTCPSARAGPDLRLRHHRGGVRGARQRRGLRTTPQPQVFATSSSSTPPRPRCRSRARTLIRYLTAGESHGPRLSPSSSTTCRPGSACAARWLTSILRQRQGGPGRGGRQ